jgi:pyruvate ferredoxin oxidoreductase alpha subunit
MGSRDAGWIQIFSEDSQEAYDQTILAMKISEELFFPVMVTTDGFIISHAMSRLEVFDDKEVQSYVGEHKTPYNVLDIDNPITVGSLVLQDYYMEIKTQQAHEMMKAKEKIKELYADFNKKMKRNYSIIEEYFMEDAEFAIVALGSTAGTARYLCEKLREKGEKVGVVKPRIFRPFFAPEMVAILENVKGIAVLDRSDMMSSTGGHLFNELKSSFYRNSKQPAMKDYIYGLGGRDITVGDIENVLKDIKDFSNSKETTPDVKYITVRE